jgi:FdhD protein
MEILPLDLTARDVSPVAFGRINGQTVAWRVAEEMPVAFLINGEHFAVMMATPDDLADFALGFALTERLVRSAADIEALRIGEAGDGLVVNIRMAAGLADRAAIRRRTLAGRAGCGICGAQTLEAALPPPPRVHGPVPGDAALAAAFAALPGAQPMKRANRSTHAAALCDGDGRLRLVREDIGRHNALDKLAGAAVRQGLRAAEGFVVLSSRVSVEMVQKAAAMGTPCLAAVSPPSALALRIATAAGMHVAGLGPEGVIRFPPGCLEEPPR